MHVTSRSESKAAEFAQLSGASRFSTSHHDLLNDPDVEAVVITYPFEMNYRLTMDTLQAGKHVLVEKPFAANMEEAQEMLATSLRTPVVSAVAENWLYWPLFPKLRAYIDEGRVGVPHTVLISSFFNIGLTNKYLSQSTWRLSSKGGLILDGGVHWMAGLRQMFGRIKSGIGFPRQMRASLGEVDSLIYQFVFENGVNGVFLNSASTIGYRNPANMVIIGSEGSIIVDNGFKDVTIMTSEGSEKEHIPLGDEGYQAEYEDFYEAVRTGKSVKSTFEGAYYDLQAMLHALDSQGKWEQLIIAGGINRDVNLIE